MDENQSIPESEDQRPLNLPYEPGEETIPDQPEAPMQTPIDEPTPTPGPGDTGPTPAAAAPVRSNRARRVLGFLALLAVLFLAGFLTAYFLLFRPADQQRVSFEKNLTEQTTSFNKSQTDLQASQTEASSLQATLTAGESELSDARVALALHSMQNDVLLARLSLATQDLLTARQALRLVDNDLKALSAVSTDKATIADLQERLNAALEAMSSNDQAAAETTLRDLSDDLNVIAGRLP